MINAIIPIAKIKPHPENYNGHPDAQLAQLEASYEEFGQYNSIVVWQRPGGDYLQVARHGFLEAMKREGATEVRADILPEDTDPMTIKRILLADNLHPQNSSPDETLLAELLQEQQNAGFDLAALGSDEEMLRQMLESLGDEIIAGNEGTDEDEEFPLENLPSRAKLGDMWKLGKHQVLVGDSTNPQHIDRLMRGQAVDACLTDPPYNVGIDYGEHKDDQTQLELEAFIRAWFSHIDAKVIVVTTGIGYNVKTLATWLRLYPPHWMGIWIRSNSMSHSPLRGFNAWEPLLIWGKPANPIGQDIFDCPVGVQDEHGNKYHPTPKPVKLWTELIEKFTKENDLIYEPFCGSGTTLIAAEKTGRRCYAIELEPKYVDLILHRWEKFTGQTATLLDRVEVEAHA